MADGLPTVDIGRFGYEAGTTNIGAGYAAGITSAGESLSKGVGQVFDVATQNRYADDTLLAMKQSGILSDKAYQAVANKSLGAKHEMLGMYASQWIQQQAQERELQKIGYTGAVSAEVERQKLLASAGMLRAGLPVAGVRPGQLVLPQQGQPQQGQPQTAPAVRPALPANVPNLAGTPQNPSPLGSGNIYNPPLQSSPQLAASVAAKPLIFGPPLGKDQIPAGSRVGNVGGRQGVLTPDGQFHPFS